MDSLTAFQISEWEAFDRLEPMGSWRDDFRLAYMCTVVTNIAIATHGKKGTKFVTPDTFMLEWDEEKRNEPKQQSVEEMKSFLLSFKESHNKNLQKRNISNTIPPKSKIHKHYEP